MSRTPTRVFVCSNGTILVFDEKNLQIRSLSGMPESTVSDLKRQYPDLVVERSPLHGRSITRAVAAGFVGVVLALTLAGCGEGGPPPSQAFAFVQHADMATAPEMIPQRFLVANNHLSALALRGTWPEAVPFAAINTRQINVNGEERQALIQRFGAAGLMLADEHGELMRDGWNAVLIDFRKPMAGPALAQWADSVLCQGRRYNALYLDDCWGAPPPRIDGLADGLTTEAWTYYRDAYLATLRQRQPHVRLIANVGREPYWHPDLDGITVEASHVEKDPAVRELALQAFRQYQEAGARGPCVAWGWWDNRFPPIVVYGHVRREVEG